MNDRANVIRHVVLGPRVEEVDEEDETNKLNLHFRSSRYVLLYVLSTAEDVSSTGANLARLSELFIRSRLGVRPGISHWVGEAVKF